MLKRFINILPFLLAGSLTATASDSAAVFNEVMYHDATGQVEWIELTNLMSVALDLSGWRIDGGIDYIFPEGTVIEPGGYVVVSSQPSEVTGSLGPWSGRLANDGELIRLRNVAGRVMDELDYRDGGRWPCGADGSGASLARRREDTAEKGPTAWTASHQINGTPGAPNFPNGADLPAGVRISEISGAADEIFRVELVNEGTAPAALGTLRLNSALLPEQTLAPGAFVVFDETQLGFRPAEGTRLFLYGAGGASLLDAAIVRAEVRARHEGKMLAPEVPTFGTANQFSFTTDVVINEIMFRSPPFPSQPGVPAESETTVLLPLASMWRYYTGQGGLSSNWAATSHAGAPDWVEGQALLGFETTPNLLPEPLRTAFASTGAITYYFETEFHLTEEQFSALTILRIQHVIDDGAIFYLNGEEIPTARFNLPAGEIGPHTPTTAGVGNAVLSEPLDVAKAELPLRVGANRLSVEVHQQIATSNDMVCGVQLSSVLETTPAVPPLPVRPNPQEWIELYNRGTTLVDLSGWKIDDAIDYTFPANTVLPAGGYLVIAKDADSLRADWPERADLILGNFAGNLSNNGERIELLDARGNPADEVAYVPGRWSDGGGSSLELIDPRADNRFPEAWADSDETTKSQWQTFTWRAPGGQRFGPTTWREFRLGMLDAGECLIDDLSVRREPFSSEQELIQNGDFSASPVGTTWRFLGNHSRSRVIDDPQDPGAPVLHLAASGPTETNHNHAETTFRDNLALSTSATYEVSFRARWLAGSNQLNTRAYYQQLAKTWELPIPSRLGTPGAANSVLIANAGPLFTELRHAPVVPAAGQSVTISLHASDPDGIASATLHYRVQGEEAFSEQPMTLIDGRWSTSLPGQTAGKILHFFASVKDSLGAVSYAPTLGPDSRALVQWQDDQPRPLSAHQLRLILLEEERVSLFDPFNLLSNETRPGTLIVREREIFYDVGVTLKGSAAARARDGDDYIGYDISFPPGRKFRGAHSSIGIDRSGRTPAVRRQDEIYVRHTFHRAGLPCPLDDLCHFIAPGRTHTGTAIMQLAGYSSTWTNSQYEEEGTVFNLDITYDPTTTQPGGNPENPKPPSPFVHVGTDFANLGEDKEQYRGPFDIRAGRRRDDYAGIITLCQTLSLPSAQLAQQAPAVLNIDEVLRCTALVNLWGVGDSYYTGGLHHNIRLFVPSSSTNIHFLPWDMDFAMSSATNASLIPSGNNLSRLIVSNPAHRRRYLSHIRHLCETVFRADYLSPWLTRYGSAVGQNYAAAASYVTARRNYAQTQYPAATPFTVTTNGGASFTTEDAEVVIEGNAWIDIIDLYLGGAPLPLQWTSLTHWRVSLPLVYGENQFTLEGVDHDGKVVASHTLSVARSGVENLGFETWRQQHFTAAELTDLTVSGPLSDPTGVGLPNLLRYAFGLLPRTQLTPPPTSLHITDGLLCLVFPRLKHAPDLEYIPESSVSLNEWTPLSTPLRVVEDHGDLETVRAEIGLDSGARFLRLRVQSK